MIKLILKLMFLPISIVLWITALMFKIIFLPFTLLFGSPMSKSDYSVFSFLDDMDFFGF